MSWIATRDDWARAKMLKSLLTTLPELFESEMNSSRGETIHYCAVFFRQTHLTGFHPRFTKWFRVALARHSYFFVTTPSQFQSYFLHFWTDIILSLHVKKFIFHIEFHCFSSGTWYLKVNNVKLVLFGIFVRLILWKLMG